MRRIEAGCVAARSALAGARRATRARGEIFSLNGGADFYGKNPKELRVEFKRLLQVFLEVCEQKGIEPRRRFSGRFDLRMSPLLRERVTIATQAQGKSIDTLAQEALRDCVASG